MSLFNFFDEVVSLPRSFDYKNSIDLIPRPRKSQFINMMVEVCKDNEYDYNNFNTNKNKLHRNETFSDMLGVSREYEK